MNIEGIKQHVRAETCEDQDEVCLSNSIDDLINSGFTQSTLLLSDSLPIYKSNKMASIYSFTSMDGVKSLRSIQNYSDHEQRGVKGPPKIDFDVGEFGKDTGGLENEKDNVLTDKNVVITRYINPADGFVSKEKKSLENSLKQGISSMKLQNKRKQASLKKLKTHESQQKKLNKLGLRVISEDTKTESLNEVPEEKRDTETEKEGKEDVTDVRECETEAERKEWDWKMRAKGDNCDNEKQLQHVAENGVKYYTDNRLVEEQREREETVSKQRLDPQMSCNDDESLEPKSFRKTLEPDSSKKNEYRIQTTEREATEDSWREMEIGDNTCRITMVTNIVSMDTQSGYDRSVFIPDKIVMQSGKYQSKEDCILFKDHGFSKEVQRKSLTTETVRNKIDLCFDSHQEKGFDKTLDNDVLDEKDTVPNDDNEFQEEEEKYVYEKSEKDCVEWTDSIDMNEKEKMSDDISLAPEEDCIEGTIKSEIVCCDVETTMVAVHLRNDVEKNLKAMDHTFKAFNQQLQAELDQLRTLLRELEDNAHNLPYTYHQTYGLGIPDKQVPDNQPKLINLFKRECFDLEYYCKVSRRDAESTWIKSRKLMACKKWQPNSSMEKSDGFYIPHDMNKGMGWPGSKGHNYGRTCSNSGGKGGNYKGDSNGSDSNQRQSGRDEDNDNYRRPEDPNKQGGDGDKDRDSGYNTHNGSQPPNVAELPPSDYKRFKKKHNTLDAVAWADFLGKFAFETRDGVITQVDTAGVSMCVAMCLSSPDDLTEEMMSCFVCISISQFLKHYADCSSQFDMCTMCVQIYSLICSHVSDCSNNNIQCDISLCTNIKHIINGGDLSSHLKTLWFHVRKKLFRIIGNVDDVDMASSESGDSITSVPLRQGRLSSITRPPSLTSIPEDMESPIQKAGSGSRILSRKRSNLANVEESTEPGSPQEEKDIEGTVTKRREPSSVIYTRGETIDDVILRNRYSDDDGIKREHRERVQSMPPGRAPEFLQENYFPSMELGTTGIKGIREVVYGDRYMLFVAARFWLNLKIKYKETGSLARHYREEGVILQEYEELLSVQGFRYKCNFQWVKHNPLGNGMSGKCHLASDFNTNFKFCVKEIHISNYEMEEIELWCELDHPHIVKIYGAIRHQETIYILQEFIEGGNLTEAINSQKVLRRRLSQVTALTYFKQLLEVLIYLRSKNILHEDIKADNILLKQEKGRVYIKVTDFGLARRCTHGMKINANPAGTQTQWSPEKSEGQGYGYPAEVWAVVCVLVHMLSGYPPWIRRFGHIKSLIIVIVQESPPLEDIPRNIEADVRDMIERGLTVCQSTRPEAAKLLRHRAFRLLDETDQGKLMSIQYSVLPSDGPAANTSIDDNADLQEIFDNLNKNKNNKLSYLPDQNRTLPVYMVQGAQKGDNSNSNQTGSLSQREVTNTERDSRTSQIVSVQPSQIMGMIDREYGTNGTLAEAPGRATIEGIDMSLMNMYLSDVETATQPITSPQAMMYYSPEQVQTESTEQTQNTQTEEMIMQTILPNFKMLGLPGFISDEDEDSNEKEDMFKDFDLEKEIPKLVQSFSQASLKSGSESPYQSGHEKSGLKDISPLAGQSVVLDEQYNTIDNEDDLFISGPTQHNINVTETSSQSNSSGAQITLHAVDKKRTQNASSSSHNISSGSQSSSSSAHNTSSGTHDINSGAHNILSGANTTPIQPFTSLQPQTNAHHRSAVSSQYQDYSLAPYLVPRDHPRHSTPRKTEIPKQSAQSPDSSGPHQPKRLKYDEHEGQSSGSLTRSSHSGLDSNLNIPEVNLPHANLPNVVTPNAKQPQQHVPNIDARRHEQLPYILDYSPNQGLRPPQLHIDLDKAQKGPTTPSTHAQTAPVNSPPSYPLQRMTSERVPPSHQLQQPNHHRTSSSTSTSQYDQQEAALRELNDALSQHSDHSHLMMMFDDEQDDPENDIPAELDIDMENPGSSIAHYLGDSPRDSIKVTFINKTLDMKLPVKFPNKSKTTKMASIFEEELSRHSALFSDLDRVIVRYENGAAVDLDSCLGDSDMTLLIEESTEEDIWYMQNGMILSSSLGLSG